MYILLSVCDIINNAWGGGREDGAGEDRVGEDGGSDNRAGEDRVRGRRGVKSLALFWIQMTFILVIIQFSERFETCFTFTTLRATNCSARLLFI